MLHLHRPIVPGVIHAQEELQRLTCSASFMAMIVPGAISSPVSLLCHGVVPRAFDRWQRQGDRIQMQLPPRSVLSLVIE